MTTINNKQIQRERLKCIRANCDNHKEVLELIQKVMDALWDLGMKTNPNNDSERTDIWLDMTYQDMIEMLAPIEVAIENKSIGDAKSVLISASPMEWEEVLV